MILLFGVLRDSGIGHLVHRLLDRGVPFLLLDPREHGWGFHLTWEVDNGRMEGVLRHGRHAAPLSKIHAAYVHNLGFHGADAQSPVHHPEQTHRMLHAFLETAPFPVCNRPSASATNMSKTYQQQIIAGQGFEVPRTLATNMAGEAVKFYERCNGRVIYKSLSARRSIVRRMHAGDLDRLDQLASGPTQFQEWIPGTDIRVHVMGRRVYPTEVTTEATDYRYSGRDGLARTMRGVQLPDDIAARCIKLAQALGMISAGVDLRRDLSGRYICFEVNPTPAFAFYEQYTGQRMTDGLIDALLEAAAG